MIDDGKSVFHESYGNRVPYFAYPYDDISFACISTADYRSPLHIQPEGASTALFLCSKDERATTGLILVLATAKHPTQDFNLITAFPRSFNVMQHNEDLYRYEIVCMKPGDMLYVRMIYLSTNNDRFLLQCHSTIPTRLYHIHRVHHCLRLQFLHTCASPIVRQRHRSRILCPWSVDELSSTCHAPYLSAILAVLAPLDSRTSINFTS